MKVSGEKLKQARLAAGASIAAVMEAADLRERRIFYLEAKGGKLNANVVKAIAKRLGVKPEALTEDMK